MLPCCFLPPSPHPHPLPTADVDIRLESNLKVYFLHRQQLRTSQLRRQRRYLGGSGNPTAFFC